MLPSAPPPRDPLALRAASPSGDLRRRLVLLTLARLGVATALLVVVLAFGGKGAPDLSSNPALVVVLAIYGVSLVYAAVLARGRDLRTLAVVQIGLDLAAWTALVAVTGGPASPVSFFFALSALTAALVLGAGAARVTAVAAIAIYGALAVVESAELGPRIGEHLGRAALSRPELVLQIVINVVAILLVAALGGALAERLSRAGGALARLEASRDALAALYEDVVRSIPVALLTCSPSGVIEGANPTAAALLGVTPANLLGTPVSTWLPFVPTDVFAADPHDRQPVPRSARAGDETLETAPSKPRVAYLAAPLYDRDGRARGGLVVIEDRSSAEAMREAVQRAERLAVLGRLAAGLAHEIRNPLGAISGCVELVREGGAAMPEQDRELLATVLREVARLNDLVTDMLVFARPRAPERAPTDVLAVAREVATLADAPGARARVTPPEDNGEPVVIEVDASQVRQVLWNLVRNAVQASPEGGRVEVAVRARRDGAVEIAVADRGRGIAPAQRERLFDVFYSETARGTGLGLAIVRQIADAHGARVEVRDREGGGTEFAVVFPRV